jgi:hypothetical protein
MRIPRGSNSNASLLRCLQAIGDRSPGPRPCHLAAFLRQDLLRVLRALLLGVAKLAIWPSMNGALSGIVVTERH